MIGHRVLARMMRMSRTFAAVAGLAVGLGAAAAGLAQVVATVDGRPITEADLRLAEREAGVDPDLTPEESRRVLVEVLIQRQVLAAAAEAARLQDGDEFKQKLQYVWRTLLQQQFLDKRARETVTEADAKRIYDEQSVTVKPEEEVRVRQIVLEREAPAMAVRARIVKGADFATLARAISADADHARLGGDLGWRTRGELPDALAEAAFALKTKGDLSAPVETEAGWHLMMLEERRTRTVPPFADLKDDIVSILVRNKAKELTQSLRDKANVVYNDRALDPQVAALSTASDPVAEVQPAAHKTARPEAVVAAAVPPSIAMPATAKSSQWRHDGSLMKLLADGERIVVQFDVPRDGLDAMGIKQGTPIFSGTRRGKTYSGEASLFSPTCGSRSFAVRGEAAKDGNSFTVRGGKPVLDASCAVASQQDEALVFEYAGPSGR